jgi:hypothetical protein
MVPGAPLIFRNPLAVPFNATVEAGAAPFETEAQATVVVPR